MISIRALGEKGGEIIADANPHTGSWFAISMITNTVIASWTPAFTVYGVLASITWPAGFIMFGNFSAIQLTSGSVVVYNTGMPAYAVG